MKHVIIIVTTLLLTFSCKHATNHAGKLVESNEELETALAEAKPGDVVIMANGKWENIAIKITQSGTEKQPITLRAETPGKVFIQGTSDLQLGGEYIMVDGLYFTNGFSPSQSVIHFSVGETVANHSTVTNCVIKDYNKLQRNYRDLWVLLKGRHNQLDHCYLAGKSNRGPTIRVDLAGNENINNHHKIIHNHFGPRPPKGGPSAETIQIGNSHTSMCPSYTLIANNLFEECNGEVEVISSKTNFNEFRNNIFYKSEGSLVTRHGNYCTIDGNYFIGNPSRSNVGGVRMIGTGHTISNNYFYQLSGKEFRSPLAVMNGIPKSPLNRYIQVTDVVIVHNSWIDCKSPWQFGVGSNVSHRDVLPASEIRSERPKRTVVANNLIYNSFEDEHPIVAHDKLDGIQFENNFIHSKATNFDTLKGVKPIELEMERMGEYLQFPLAELKEQEIYKGFGFEQFDKDLFGNERSKSNQIGAIISKANAPSIIPDKSLYGPNWFEQASHLTEGTTHKVSENKSLQEALREATSGDVIEIEAGNYQIKSPLKINKTISIKSIKGAAVNIRYDGPAKTALFEMCPAGKLALESINLTGDQNQFAFASLKENMSSLYNLRLDNCHVENFDSILKAHKYSFSEHIHFVNSSFSNCQNGMDLSEEKEDRGEYNAENIIIENCKFVGIAENVINYYRGGYDESTDGGNLKLINNTFTLCGDNEKSNVLLKTYGIINVDISNNTFKNNNPEKIAILWGAKNNQHSNNVIINSGKIFVEENLKLKTFY